MPADTFLNTIKKKGGRITKARRAILESLQSLTCPISAADIKQALEKKKLTINRTTVYRELSFLVANGLVREVRFLGKPSLFELCDSHHHHLVCIGCNNVVPVEMKMHLTKQEQQIAKKNKFFIVEHTLEFYGFCSRCIKKQ